MKNRSQPLPKLPALTQLDAVEREKIRAQLTRLLESPPFRSSRRCSDFLRHVVEESCEGRSEQLKERTLGVAVFERDPDYDTNQDPVVRNTAGQVRKRLAQYYCEPGRDREIRIDLPPGSYVPEIQVPDSDHAGQASVTAPVSLTLPESIVTPAHVAPVFNPAQRRLPRWAIPVFATAAALGVAGYWAATRPGYDPIKEFWGPVVRHSGPVVLVVGQGHTYRLNADLDRVFDESSGALPDRQVRISDIVPAFDRYIGLTDAKALVRLAGVFSTFGKPVELRGGRTTSLSDLRGKPVVLVGAFNNSWTLSLTGESRFFFEHDQANGLEVVRDRQRPENRAWNVETGTSAEQIRMDYAIVSRVFNPTTEQAVVVAAGIRGGGTEAASEFLTSRGYLAQALKSAPRGWEKKNAQFVLTTRLFGGNPGPPTVVAAHYW